MPYNSRLIKLEPYFKKSNDEMAAIISKLKTLQQNKEAHAAEIQSLTDDLVKLQKIESSWLSETTQITQKTLEQTFLNWANEIPYPTPEAEEALRIALEELHIGLKVTGMQGDKEVQDLLKNRVASVIQKVFFSPSIQHKESQIILNFGALGHKWHEKTQEDISLQESRKFSAAYAAQRTINDILEEMPVPKQFEQEANELQTQLSTVQDLQKNHTKHSSEYFVLKSLQDDIAGIQGTFLKSRHCFNIQNGHEHIEERRRMLSKTKNQIQSLPNSSQDARQVALQHVDLLHIKLNLFDNFLTQLIVEEIKTDMMIELADMHASLNVGSAESPMHKIAMKLLNDVEKLFSTIEKKHTNPSEKAHALKTGMETLLSQCETTMQSISKSNNHWTISSIINTFSPTSKKEMKRNEDDVLIREEGEENINLKEIVDHLREHLNRLSNPLTLEKANTQASAISTNKKEEEEGGKGSLNMH